MAIGFVLQGGGSLAAAQVGMLRALLERGITPDLVVGTSAGAVNAVCFAQDPTEHGLERLELLWKRVRRGDVFPFNLPNLLTALTGHRDGMVSPRRLRRLLERNVDVLTLDDTRVPVHVVATDVATGEAVVLSEGPVVDALLASTALPGVFPPVEIAGRPLLDGGVSADTPILQAEALGASVSYVLPSVGPATESEIARGAVPILLRAVTQVLGRATAIDVAAARGTVHVLPPPVRGSVNPFSFRPTGKLIDLGYEVARAALAGEPPVAPDGRPAERDQIR